jgi:hypothetical protein
MPAMAKKKAEELVDRKGKKNEYEAQRRRAAERCVGGVWGKKLSA